MKRLFAVLLSAWMIAGAAQPVRAAAKPIQRLDEDTFSYVYDGPGKIVGDELQIGKLELGEELRLYLRPSDFVAADGTRLEALTLADLEAAKFTASRFVVVNTDPAVPYKDLVSMSLQEDAAKKTVYIRLKTGDSLPSPGDYRVLHVAYLSHNDWVLGASILNIHFTLG